MTGYTMCPKYSAMNAILNANPMEDTDPKMVFINFDNILNEILNQWSDIGYQSETNKPKVVSSVVQFVLEIIGHYRQYFKDYMIVLYHTDVESNSQLFKTNMENGVEYRTNYISRFDTIKFRQFKKLYVDSLYGIIQNTIDAIPDVYMIRTKNIDSSIIPLTFAREFPERKIIVVTWDNVDTLLGFYTSNITVIYDGRKNGGVSPEIVNGRKYIDTMTNTINPNHYGMFATRVLLAAVGSYDRSLYGIGKKSGNGYDVVGQWLQNTFENNVIPIKYNDYKVISSQIKNPQQRIDFENSYLGMDLEYQYQLLTADEKTDILYRLDHTPVDPNEIIKLFPNILIEWDKIFH